MNSCIWILTLLEAYGLLQPGFRCARHARTLAGMERSAAPPFAILSAGTRQTVGKGPQEMLGNMFRV
jgi:hypothetical protein